MKPMCRSGVLTLVTYTPILSSTGSRSRAAICLSSSLIAGIHQSKSSLCKSLPLRVIYGSSHYRSPWSSPLLHGQQQPSLSFVDCVSFLPESKQAQGVSSPPVARLCIRFRGSIGCRRPHLLDFCFRLQALSEKEPSGVKKQDKTHTSLYKHAVEHGVVKKRAVKHRGE